MSLWKCTECDIDISDTYCQKCNKNKNGQKKFMSKFTQKQDNFTFRNKVNFHDKTNDWTCKNCNINIYGGKRYCIRCHQDIQGNQNMNFGQNRQFTQKRFNTWRCRVCNENIQKIFTYCNNCDSESSNWTCIKCKSVNPTNKQFCSICDINLQGRNPQNVKVFGDYTDQDQAIDFAFTLGGRKTKSTLPENIINKTNQLPCNICLKPCLDGKMCFSCIIKQKSVSEATNDKLLSESQSFPALDLKQTFDNTENQQTTDIPVEQTFFIDSVINEPWL